MHSNLVTLPPADAARISIDLLHFAGTPHAPHLSGVPVPALIAPLGDSRGTPRLLYRYPQPPAAPEALGGYATPFAYLESTIPLVRARHAHFFAILAGNMPSLPRIHLKDVFTPYSPMPIFFSHSDNVHDLFAPLGSIAPRLAADVCPELTSIYTDWIQAGEPASQPNTNILTENEEPTSPHAPTGTPTTPHDILRAAHAAQNSLALPGGIPIPELHEGNLLLPIYKFTKSFFIVPTGRYAALPPPSYPMKQFRTYIDLATYENPTNLPLVGWGIKDRAAFALLTDILGATDVAKLSMTLAHFHLYPSRLLAARGKSIGWDPKIAPYPADLPRKFQPINPKTVLSSIQSAYPQFRFVRSDLDLTSDHYCYGEKRNDVKEGEVEQEEVEQGAEAGETSGDEGGEMSGEPI